MNHTTEGQHPMSLATVTVDPYDTFLETKVSFDVSVGHVVDPTEIHPSLFPHQRDIVRWAVAGGRRAIFARFGLGKSIMQLETVRLTLTRFPNGAGLIVCPLGVRQEFQRDAVEKLGMEPLRFVRRTADVDGPGIYITNYESIRDGKLDPALFAAVSLDEASVLRSYGSKTYQEFLTLFENVPARFVATATPSPNRYKELIHYAAYLGVMDSGQSLTRWFKRDSTKANNLTLFPHKEAEFWLWLSSWAAFVQQPSDLGYPDDGYVLPPMEVHRHEVSVDHTDGAGVDRDGQARLYRGGDMSMVEASREKRATLELRIEELMAIVNQYRADDELDQIVLWCDLNDEQTAIERALTAAGITWSSIHGSLDVDEAERRMAQWRNRETVALIGKPVMLGQGVNLQQCNKAVFVGITYKFNDLIQACHRLQRFGQTRTVHTHIIHADSERSVYGVLMEKWEQHEELTATMSALIRDHGLNQLSIDEALRRSIGVERIEASGDGWMHVLNDTVDEGRRLDDNSIDMMLTSIPFANQYEYTAAAEDFGHTDNPEHFWRQMDYLTPNLLRALRPGRLFTVHVKDRILFGNQYGTGSPTVSPLHAQAIDHYRRHGFDYCGMITVVTDVVRENNQTYRLTYGEMRKDGTRMGVGMPEYILLLRKPQSDRTRGYADVPVGHTADEYSLARWQIDAASFWRSSGDRALSGDEFASLTPQQQIHLFTQHSLENIYDYEAHLQIGEKLSARGTLPKTFTLLAPGSHHPEVWHDVNRMNTANTAQVQSGREAHVCLARGALVLTRGDGYKPIEQVCVGEHVLTHNGRWRPVVAVQNTGVRPVVNLRAQGVPGLVLTPDHKVWARDVSKYARKADYARRVEPSWVPAADTVGSYVNRKLAPIEVPSVVDTLTWWVAGRWLADGHIDARGCAILSCGAHEVDDLANRLGRFGGNPFRPTGSARQVQLRDPDFELRRILKSCGMGATGKHLPADAFTLPVEQAAALLDGYLSGDGHFLPDRQRWMASSVSKELMLGVAYLAHRVHGAVASVYAGRPARAGKILGRDVNMAADWILSFDLPIDGRRRSQIVLEDGAWMKVRSADEVGEVETWNLRVDEDESFTAEGMVVKNCPLQFDIVDRLIERFTNPGELVYDPFGGLATTAFRAMRLGRRGRAVELNPTYWADGVRYCQIEERKASMPTLFDVADLSLEAAS